MRTETRRDDNLVYFKQQGDDTEYCTTPIDWKRQQLRLRILRFGIDPDLLAEYDAAVLANFWDES